MARIVNSNEIHDAHVKEVCNQPLSADVVSIGNPAANFSCMPKRREPTDKLKELRHGLQRVKGSRKEEEGHDQESTNYVEK